MFLGNVNYLALLKNLVLCAGVLFLLYLTVSKVPGRIDQLATPVQKTGSGQSKVASSLLKRLIEHQLVLLEPSSLAIKVPPPDVALRLVAQSNGAQQSEDLDAWRTALNANASDDAQGAIKKLHRNGPTEIGVVLRASIAQWNDHHRLAAVRDSHTNEDGTPLWTSLDAKIRDYVPDKIIDYERHLDTSAFGFFGLGTEPPIGTWATARPVPGANTEQLRHVTFKRTIAPEQEVMIDILGTLVDHKGLPRGTQYEQALCHDPDLYDAESLEADPACTANGAIAHRFKVLASEQAQEISVTLAPTPYVPTSLYPVLQQKRGSFPLGWAQCGENKESWTDYLSACRGDGWQVYGDLRPIVLMCRSGKDASSGQADCAIGWHTGRGTGMNRIAPNVEVKLLGGEPLISLPGETQTLLTAEGDLARQLKTAESLGLQTFLGTGRGDTQGLLGAMRSQYAIRVPASELAPERDTKSIELSLDKTLQAGLVQELTRSDLNFAGGDAVSFVLLDATDRCWDAQDTGCSVSTNRGAIRAAVAMELGKGRGPSTLASEGAPSLWNETAAAAWKRRVGVKNADPTLFAWRSDGSRYAPGSTFKSVTALAAIDVAVTQQNQALLRSIRGGRDPMNIVRPLPLPNGAVAHSGYVELQREPHSAFAPANCGPNPSALQDAGGGRICNFAQMAAVKPSGNRCAATSEPRFGLCEATHDSINNYFVAMGLALETAQPSAVTTGTGDPAIIKMARHLVSNFYTMTPLEARLGNIYSRFWGNGFAAMESAADFRVDVAKVYAIGQNSYGHNMESNTAAMAAVYGAIATGCRADPTLQEVPRACEPVFSGQGSLRWDALDLMQETLVPGLKSVVEAEGTTSAFTQNRSLRARVHAKTGTAGFGARNTVWLAGWLEPQSGQPDGPRYAFACMVKNVRRGNFGGSICGPIARRVLEKVVEVKG